MPMQAASAAFFQLHGLAVAEGTGFAFVSDTFSSYIRPVSLHIWIATAIK
jgi:hypothetical protein